MKDEKARDFLPVLHTIPDLSFSLEFYCPFEFGCTVGKQEIPS
jgi:hypothetical protein